MSNAVLLLIALAAVLTPSLVSYFTAIEVSHMWDIISQNIVTILLSYFIYRGLSWKSRCAKAFTLLILVASSILLVNLFITRVENEDLFNYVIEKDNE